MKRSIVLILFGFALCSPGAQPEAAGLVYRLVQAEPRADFGYDWLREIDGAPPPVPTFDGAKGYPVGNLKTVPGDFTVRRYYADTTGDTSEGRRPVRHLLALKLRDDVIVDAFHYTLTWQDSPSIVLYRMGAGVRGKLTLSEGLSTDAFEFAGFVNDEREFGWIGAGRLRGGSAAEGL